MDPLNSSKIKGISLTNFFKWSRYLNTQICFVHTDVSQFNCLIRLCVNDLADVLLSSKQTNKKSEYVLILLPTKLKDFVLIGNQLECYINSLTLITCKFFHSGMSVELWTIDEWNSSLSGINVIVMQCDLIFSLFQLNIFSMNQFELIIIYGCERLVGCETDKFIVEQLSKENRILAINCDPIDLDLSPKILSETLDGYKHNLPCYHFLLIIDDHLFNSVGYSILNQMTLIRFQNSDTLNFSSQCLQLIQYQYDAIINLPTQLSESLAVRYCISILDACIYQLILLGSLPGSRSLLKLIRKLEKYLESISLISKPIYNNNKSNDLLIQTIGDLLSCSIKVFPLGINIGDCFTERTVLESTLTCLRTMRRIFLHEWYKFINFTNQYIEINDIIHKQQITHKVAELFAVLHRLYKGWIQSVIPNKITFQCIVLTKCPLTCSNLCHGISDLFRVIACDTKLTFDFLSTFQKNSEEYEDLSDKQIHVRNLYNNRKINVLFVNYSTLNFKNINLYSQYCLCFDPPESYGNYLFIKDIVRPSLVPDQAVVILSGCFQFHDLKTRLENYNKKDEILGQYIFNSIVFDQESSKCSLILLKELDPLNRSSISGMKELKLLLNYCAKITTDSWTVLQPKFEFFTAGKSNNRLFTCFISIPSDGVIQNIYTSQFCKSITDALYQSCEYLCTELQLKDESNNFKSIDRNYIANQLQLDDLSSSFKPSDKHPIVYTIPEMLLSRFSDRQKNNFIIELHLYRVVFTLDVYLSSERYSEYWTKHSSIGIMTVNQIIDIPEFPIFSKEGAINVQIKYCSIKQFSKLELSIIEAAHESIFSKVFMINSNMFEFVSLLSNNTTEPISSNLLCTILHSELDEIMWPIVTSIAGLDLPALINYKCMCRDCVELNNYHFVHDNFQDAIVLPNYRPSSTLEYFRVLMINYHMNPNSTFLSDSKYCRNNESFLNYYERKYHIKFSNCDQPLLLAERCSGRINLLTPRYMNPLSLRDRILDRSNRRQNRQRQIYFIPEIMTIHPIKWHYWNQIWSLPSILHRITTFMKCAEFRDLITNDDDKIRFTTPTKYESLQFPWHITKERCMSTCEENPPEFLSVLNVDCDFEISTWTGRELDSIDIDHHSWAKKPDELLMSFNNAKVCNNMN
ncbi:hypothetical protein GJ496_002437 [Pomphorhynchus laevis]|nr:hypothetical protein GJ496_002437 [Pomphorhynchus laevis]